MLKLAVGSALLVTVTQGWGFSLGATQGNVIIGRPLDVLVQSNIDASEAADGLCLEAEVIYGDHRVAASAVTAAIHSVGMDGKGALRVRASEPVSEPFVTVVLKAGCQQTFRRSYTLLADLDMPAPVRTTSVRIAAPAATSAPKPAATSGGGTSTAIPRATAGSVAGSSASARLMAPAPVQAPETPIRLPAPAPRPAGVVFKSKFRPPVVLPRAEAVAPATATQPVITPDVSGAQSGARLKLDPVDVSAANGPASPNAPDAVPEAGANSQATVAEGAAAADPTGASATAPEVTRELELLRVEQEKLRLAMETMNAQLAEAEANRYQNPVVYGLGAAVLALLGGLWVVWRRRAAGTAAEEVAAGANPWWETKLPDTADSLQPNPAEPTAAPGSAPAAPAIWGATDDFHGLEVSEAGESMFREVPITPLNPEALLDLWQRVDFFESLGQYNDAMEALKAFVSEQPRASEAPYLRWMTLAKHHGEGEDAAVAQAFYEHHYQRLASALPTDVDLTADGAATQALIAEWPMPAARRWLEHALSSQPGDPASPMKVRTLGAFDDLLLLLGTLEAMDALPATTEVDPATPVALPAAAVAAPDLSLDFPAWTTADQLQAKVEDAAAEAHPESAASPETSEVAEDEHAPLDFDFFKWEPPGAGEGESKEDPQGADKP